MYSVLALATIHAQQVLTGRLLDAKTGEAIEFANIGVVGKGVGTVSNENGAYTLTVPDSVAGEPVRISRIGYQTLQQSVAVLKGQPVVRMQQEATALSEVLVSAKKLKIKKVGNVTTTRNVSGGFKKNSLGAELAIRIPIKHPKTQIRRFFINIVNNTIDKPVFRFNVYSIDKNGRPKDNVLNHNIVFSPLENTGLVELDLTPYAIFVDDDVFIAIEWLKDLGDVKGLHFSTKLMGGGTYFRSVSQADWEKLPSFGLGLHAEIAY